MNIITGVYLRGKIAHGPDFCTKNLADEVKVPYREVGLTGGFVGRIP